MDKEVLRKKTNIYYYKFYYISPHDKPLSRLKPSKTQNPKKQPDQLTPTKPNPPQPNQTNRLDKNVSRSSLTHKWRAEIYYWNEPGLVGGNPWRRILGLGWDARWMEDARCEMGCYATVWYGVWCTVGLLWTIGDTPICCTCRYFMIACA